MSKKSSESCLSILLKMSIMLGILALVAIVSVYFAYQKLNEFFNRGETMVVPDFRGMHIVEVFKSKPAGLDVVRRDEKYDDKQPKDHVIAQFPDPGTVVKQGKKVQLSISLGIQRVAVPDMKGNNMREIDLALLNSQLVAGDRAYIYSDKVAHDRLIGQSPMPGEEYGVNKEVDLLISLGRRPESLVLPSLVGSTLDEGKNKLKAWGFNFGRIYSRKDSGRPKFQIISTTPSPYSRLKKGEVVSLLISAGDDEGTATSEDLKKFEIFSGAKATSAKMPDPAEKPDQNMPPPKILIADSPASANVTSNPAVKPAVNPAVNPAIIVAPPEVEQEASAMKELSFVMPDGFMPKEVKFIHITPVGREQIYAGTHKPLDLVKVKAPKVPNSKVQIYINDVPIEERTIE
ncbi:MAG: PASTA domain-containing protein [Candidatus Riflebacteria bacterium]